MTSAPSTPANRAVADNTVVTVEFWIHTTDGQALDDSGGPVSFLHRGHDSLLERLNDGIEGKQAGFDQVFHLEPEDAFGDYDADLLRIEPRSRFPEPLEVGMRFEGIPDTADEEDQGMIYTVTDMTEDQVVLDSNHPFAGMALRIRIKILDVRRADAQEVEQGYAEPDDDDESLLDTLLETQPNRKTLH